jgi:hypothetical protein
MNAEKELLAAYGEWRRLSRAAGQAIRSRRWNFLLECQAVLKKLQPRITQLTREVRAGWQRSAADFAAKEKNLNALILQLITLSEQNRSLLATARATAKLQRVELEQSGRNLKRLEHSYVAHRPVAWTSFS